MTTPVALADHGLYQSCPTLDCDQLAAPLKFEPYRAVISALPFVGSTTYPFYAEISGFLPVLFIVICTPTSMLPRRVSAFWFFRF